MPRQRRNNDWGFPRWRDYGAGAAAATVRLCDRHGCTSVGDRPAPKAPNSPERWWFCQAHAAEYNAGWDYFRGLTPEEAAAREQAEAGQRKYQRASHWAWGDDGDGSRSRAELDALKLLGLDADADMKAIRAAWRSAAKASHPDVAGNSPEAAERFRAVQAAWDVLSSADAARTAARQSQA
ncbi:MAG: J domain-containing protein [Alphaproteobacteria bacterium]|nr:J domain-containing protein [Alphaproteobacteria bacterium]